MRLLVTGGSGLVGRFVVDSLSKRFETEVLDVKKPARADLVYHHDDILELGALLEVVKGYDAVVHLAGIPHPLDTPPEVVFRVNALGTFNILEACTRNNIRRLVFMSSESTLGFAFSTNRLWPQYVPIDEHHPLRPQDSYGLSKLVCEQLCRGFSLRTGMLTICLRAPWIWVPQEAEIAFYRRLVADYPSWSKNLWAFIHVADVARAIESALLFPGESGFHAVFISAAENWTGRSSRELLQRFYPETRTMAADWTGAASFLSHRKANELLGFSPTLSVKDIL